MKFKKLMAGLTSLALMASLAGCGGSSNGTANNSSSDTTADTNAADSADTESADSSDGEVPSLTDLYGDDTIQLTVYSQLANYSGKLTGWFAEVMKREFNVEMTIIPDTDGAFDTRMESGNLGDIVVFGSNGSDYQRAVKEGMLFDWNEDDILSDYGPYVKEHMPYALETMLTSAILSVQVIQHTASVITLQHLLRIMKRSSIQWIFAGIFIRSLAILSLIQLTTSSIHSLQ